MEEKTSDHDNQRPVSDPRVCKVCGEAAGKHSYYGGQVCLSCRAFFRRSVYSGQANVIKPFACNLSLFVKNNQDNFWHEWETYIFLQHLIEGLQNKYNFLTTNVNSAHGAEGYPYMTRIITPADVTIYCVWAAIVPFHSPTLVFWSVIFCCKQALLRRRPSIGWDKLLEKN